MPKYHGYHDSAGHRPDIPEHHGYVDGSNRPTFGVRKSRTRELPQYHGYKEDGQPDIPQHHGYLDNSHVPE
jgi:hypothetical protein